MTTTITSVTIAGGGARVFPADEIPCGWYQIGWSGEFEPGVAHPLRYFSRDLVAFRGESGELHVLDAYCPHMGAHLGYGGRVVGDEVACPYHGWQWDGVDGHNTCIPYGDKDKMRLGIRAWRTVEVDGIALVWYAPDAESEPFFDPPTSFFRGDAECWPTYPETTRLWRDVAMTPQHAAENVPDAAHFQYIHGATTTPTLASFKSDGGNFHTLWTLRFGEGKRPTWATPQGPMEGRIVTEAYGLGLGWNTQYAFDDITSLSGYTPIDPYHVDVRLTVWAPRTRSDGSPLDQELRDRWFEFQSGQIESDLNVWSHQTYIARAPFASNEMAAMRALRDWSEQFYPSGRSHARHGARPE